ncbi:MAG: oligosaccharide flippase family protein, partial [Mangrovimonas sp.]|nr:oligosaccharide flippase family protein [Mangrovimonas sp.]
MSQLKKGAILNYTTIILTNVVGLLLTPFIIRQLGDSEFGLYTMIGSFVGYIAVLDFGLSDAVVRFVAKYRAEKDKKGEENFLANTMLIYLVISTLVVLVGTVFYLNMDSVFQNSLTANELVQAKIMFAILVFNLAISLPAGSFTGICFGYEQFAFPKSAKIIRYISRSVLVVALLLLGGKAIAMVILDTVLNIVLDAVLIWYVFKRLGVKIKLHQYNFKLVKNIFSYSLWIFVFVIVSQFQW